MRMIACIEDPDRIQKILTYLDAKGAETEATRRPPCRAPPPMSSQRDTDGCQEDGNQAGRFPVYRFQEAAGVWRSADQV